MDIIRIHRIGAKGKCARAIFHEMDESGKEIIWKYKQNFKGTNFSVMNQLTLEPLERRR